MQVQVLKVFLSITSHIFNALSQNQFSVFAGTETIKDASGSAPSKTDNTKHPVDFVHLENLLVFYFVPLQK